MTSPRLTGISSMATRLLLADLADAYQRHSGVALHVESVGGLDAARRVQAGETFDLVVLAAEAIDKLVASGHVAPGSKVDLARSGVAVAVRAGSARPDIGSEDALRHAVLSARSVGYSTGPSGVALAALFQRWGLAETLRARTVQTPPGVPVGSLVATGEIELGFQQLSELMHLEGVELLGPLPAAVQIVTTFSAGRCTHCTQPEAVAALFDYLLGAQATPSKLRHGMQPA